MTKRLLPVFSCQYEEDFPIVHDAKRQKHIVIDDDEPLEPLIPWLTSLPKDVLELIVNTYCSKLDRVMFIFTSKDMYRAVIPGAWADYEYRVPDTSRWVHLAAKEGSNERVIWAALYCMKKQDREDLEKPNRDSDSSCVSRLQHIFCGAKINANDYAGDGVSWPDHQLLYQAYSGASKSEGVHMLNAFCSANQYFLFDRYHDWYMTRLGKAGGRGRVDVLQWHVRMCAIHKHIIKKRDSNGKVNPWIDGYSVVKRIMKRGQLGALQYYYESGGKIRNRDFHIAARLGHLPIIKWLNEIGRRNIDSETGPILLSAAARSGNFECFQYILNTRKVDLNLRTVIKACKGGNAKILESIWNTNELYFAGTPEIRNRMVTQALVGASVEAVQWLREKDIFTRLDQDIVEITIEYTDCRRIGYDVLSWLVKEGYTWKYDMLGDLGYFSCSSCSIQTHLGKMLDAGVPWPIDAMATLAKESHWELMKWARSRCLDWGPHHLCAIGFETFDPYLADPNTLDWLLSPNTDYVVSKEEFEEITSIVAERKFKSPGCFDDNLIPLYKMLKERMKALVSV